jgi:hypothetical protein
VKLVDQWRTIESSLPADWSEVRLDIVVETAGELGRAAQLLGPANPGRVGNALRILVRRAGGGGAIGAEGARRLFGRLDEARIWSVLHLVDSQSAPQAVQALTPSLAESWDKQLAALPADWSDVEAELRLVSSDFLPRAALLCAPLNPEKAAGLAFRFRCARAAGYGASPTMVRRCLERLDAERIGGELEILHVLSSTRHVATQGPVWRVGGRAV